MRDGVLMNESFQKAKDSKDNLYEVKEDHASARPVGSEEWRDLADLRMEVGPLYLIPKADNNG
jgi:hypothetical protein